MNLFVYISKIIIPLFRYWVLSGIFMLGNPAIADNQLVFSPAELEVAYLQPDESVDAGGFDLLAHPDWINSEIALAPSLLAEFGLLVTVPKVHTCSYYPVYSSSLKLDGFVNAYARNVFYVFVTALAP